MDYIYLCRSKEVLKIIAKVLALNDDQLVALGLKVPNIDIVSSIISTVIGKPNEKEIIMVISQIYICMYLYDKI